mmetsp:Transcript_35391/g.105727  ORF Transcript_35391/g.105727 Transcript_35391/m.105727 type:complete len:109 (-) Transcript_35391:506-832(-)
MGRFSSVRKLLKRLIVECLPVKTRAVHLYVGDQYAWWHMVLRTIFLVWGRMHHQRMVLHVGTGEMLASELEKFGMSRDQIPIELGGGVKFDNWNDWIENMRSSESSEN